MDIQAELSCGGVAPTGPVSGWPQERHEALMAAAAKVGQPKPTPSSGPSVGKMARGLARSAGQALRNGRVSEEIRNERYDTCKACPMFNAKSKRCTDCGCFMEAKTWIGGNPDYLCPQKKWSR